MPVFKPDPDPSLNAYLDRVAVPWCLYADGYYKAAALLINQCETFYDRNTLIYPIVFLYRQYIELAFKEFILDGSRYRENLSPPQTHHNLNRLWQLCAEIIRERKLPVPPAHIQMIEKVVGEFNTYDPSSEAFRYPVTKRGARSLASAEVPLSIRGLAQTMKEVEGCLRNLDALLDADTSLQREFNREI